MVSSPSTDLGHATVTDAITIAAPPEAVWRALVDPQLSARWRNAAFETDWEPGSPIRITATIGSKDYLDRGTVIATSAPTQLCYRFLPTVSGLPDVPESYSTVTMLLMAEGAGTMVAVTHTVPPSPTRRGDGWEIGPESGHKHVVFYWRSTLPILRDLVEGRPNAALGDPPES